MPLLSRDAPGAGLPPQGWLYYQPQTNWTSTFGLTFWQVVDQIREMRLKNPRFAAQWTTDRNAIADELDFFTCVRLHNDPRWCTPEGQKKTTAPPQWQTWQQPSPPSRPSAGAAGAAERVENFAAGVGVVLDWLGDSLEPVPLDLAERRAAVCAGCTENGRPDFIQRLEGWAASGVKELMNLAHDLNLKTSQDANLFHCQICDCALRLKVWCKMDHILAHTSERVMAGLPDFCWIKKKDQ